MELKTGDHDVRKTAIEFYKTLFEELEPQRMQQNFLKLLMEMQQVGRGSIWVKGGDGYLCVEAAGAESDRIKSVVIPEDRPSLVRWVIEKGEMTIAEAGKDQRHFKELEDDFDVKSTLILCYPLILKSGEVYGAVQIIDTSSGGDRINLDKDYLSLLQSLVDIGSIALSNSISFKDQLQENLRLKQTLEFVVGGAIIGQSRPFREAMKIARNYAQTDFPVLITGESGSGKDIMAKEIHRQSKRKGKPFMVQNCSAIPDTLLESELFGYKKGAFTGATQDKKGLFEAANGGTVFLDEIGDMDMHLQARILRVIQNKEIKPLGGSETKQVDVRIITATNKDLSREISEKRFREDLFYRLNVLPLHLPPLRERRDDIPALLEYFLKKESVSVGKKPKQFSKDTVNWLMEYPWRGNIRELENFVKYVITTVEGEVIRLIDLPSHMTEGAFPAEVEETETDTLHAPAAAPPRPGSFNRDEEFDGATWEDVERSYVEHLLDKNKWNVTKAAKDAGVNRSTFDSRMKRLGIQKS